MSLASAIQQRRHHVGLMAPDDFDGWRAAARSLVQAGMAPDQVAWSEPGGIHDLFAFGGEAEGDDVLPDPLTGALPVRANRAFLELAKSAICHADPARFDLLYRVIWRLQARPRLMEDEADRDVRNLDAMARAVRRDIHKMRAFVRFREVHVEGGEARFVAWFEPEHHILRANAGFFTRRFANMRWSILTPAGTLHWDGEQLEEGPPARREDAPLGDPLEDMWKAYYASIFNPARLKVGAMLKEMPRKYWKNMPEAALIPALVAGAQAQEAAMVKAGKVDLGDRPETLAAIADGIHDCRHCAIGGLNNVAVRGEGPQSAVLMIVGEQPGDQEDQLGRPFVGPAGQVLDMHLEKAGIDRSRAYLTNAVKHFKFTMQGKRRLHQNPTSREIDMCRWWLESELAIVRPRLVLALGASAARGLLGRTVSITQARGKPHDLEDGSELWITAHPSYLLRLRDMARDQQEALFQVDLVAVGRRLGELTSAR